MTTIKMTELPSGLRVITDTVNTVESVAIGAWVDAGSRHEDMEVNGIAHMTEHMMFKGTPTRSAQRIAEEIEDFGGHVNAYTSRDVTAYHIHALKENLHQATDIIADLIINSNMPDEEVERERHVVLQEIGMTIDTPDDLVFDLHQECAFPDQPLGAPILGTVEIIKNMSRDALMNNVANNYTANNMVVSAAGNLDHDELVAYVAEQFDNCPKGNKKRAMLTSEYKGGELRQERESEQSHIILGFQGISRHDDDYYAMTLLSSILGSGMSSRLFQEIRERRGLAYSVFSYHYAYQDNGMFGIYTGTGPDDLPELIPALCSELLRISDDAAQNELDRAITQVKSTTLMGQESMMRRINSQAKHLIYHDEIIDIHERITKIEAVTLDDIKNVARRVFATKPTLTALGPLEKLESFDKIEERLKA